MKPQILRNFCLLILALAFSGQIFAEEGAATTASSLFQQGVTAYETGDYKGALKLFRQMQADFPRSARAIRGWEYIALCENKLGDPYAAFEAYQEIWDNHKEFSKMQVITRNQMRIGNHYMEYKRYSVAEKIFSKILENAPYSEAAPAAQYSLGMAQYNLKKFGPARESFEAVCQNFPTSQLVDDSAFMLGIVDSAAAMAADYDQTSTDRAIASFRNYIREFPTADHVGDAQLHIRALRDRKAQSIYDQAYYYDYSGHAKSAIMHYELLITEYPDTDCADKAKMRLAALKGEPVQGMPKDKVKYVDPTPDAGAVSSQKEQDEAARSFRDSDSSFGQPKAQSAPFDENKKPAFSESTPEITSSGSAFDEPKSNYPLKKDPAQTEDQRVERTAALTAPSSSMQTTGDNWRQNQSREVMNTYLQDPKKKQELTDFMKEEYEKEAETQQASAALLKLYQQNNPDAVPPPVSEYSAEAYVKKQLSKEQPVLSEEVFADIKAADKETGKSVGRIESVWAPVPGTETKVSAPVVTAQVEQPKVQAQVKVEEPTFTAPKTTAPARPTSQPVSRIQSSEWQTVGTRVDFGEEKIDSPQPRISNLSDAERNSLKASEVVSAPAPSYNVSYSGSMPVFHEVNAAPSVSASVATSQPSFQTVSAPQEQTTVQTQSKAEVMTPSFAEVKQEAVSEPIKITELSSAPVTAEVKVEKVEESVESLIPSAVKETPVKVTVTTNTGLRVTRETVKPVFKEETVPPVGEKVSVKVGAESSGATSQDVTSVLPGGLMDDKAAAANANAIVEPPKDTRIRTMPEAGRVSTAISAEQYKRVVEEKDVKDASSETTLINAYKKAYGLVQKAESYANQNDNVNARFYYSQALDSFTALKAQAPPNWKHMDILDTRIQKCREELHRID